MTERFAPHDPAALLDHYAAHDLRLSEALVPALPKEPDFEFTFRATLESPVDVDGARWFQVTITAMAEDEAEGIYYSGEGLMHQLTAKGELSRASSHRMAKLPAAVADALGEALIPDWARFILAGKP